MQEKEFDRTASEEQTKESLLLGSEKGVFQPNKERNHRGVYFPPFWKKKKLKCSFVSKLEETAKREPAVTDEHGEYKEGVFLYNCTIVQVMLNKAGLWSLAIRSDNPIGLPMIQEIRYKYIPDSCLMALLLPSRAEKPANNIVELYQIPDEVGNGANNEDSEA